MNQPYDQYKPSGIDWLGNIPSHWEVKKLKYLLESVLGGGTPSTEDESFWNGKYPWVSPKDMKSDLITKTEDTVTELAISKSATCLVPENAVLVVVRSGILKHTLPVAINAIPVTLNQDMKALLPNHSTNTEYLSLLLKGFQHNILSQCSKIGATVDSIETEWLYNYSLPLPPLSEQRAIADYLDRKTAQIDDLVARKEQLLALLQRKRQTIINEAVTRGLDTNAPKKDSGIEWLGKIPADWEVKKLKYLVNLIMGGGTPDTTKEEFWNGDLPWVSPKDMKSPIISTTQDYVTELAVQSSATSIIPTSSVMVVVRSGILKHTFPVAINAVPVTLNQDMKAFVPNELITSEYMALLFKGFQTHILNQCTKIGATVDSVETEWLYNFQFPLPSLDEQEVIAKFLATQNAKIDQVVSDIKTQRAYLKTYRQSLISEVVTGKVDVRAKVPAEL